MIDSYIHSLPLDSITYPPLFSFSGIVARLINLQGVMVLGRMGLAVLRAAMLPCWFVVKKAAGGFIKTVTSS